MPRFEPQRCEPSCNECAAVCPTAAITVRSDQAGNDRLDVDYGRCVVCQLCVEACPGGCGHRLLSTGLLARASDPT